MTMNNTLDGNQHLLTPPTLDLSSEMDLQSLWRTWLDKWQDYTVVTNLHKKSTQYRSSMLRYCFADSTRTIYNSLELNCVERNDPEKIIYALGKFIDDTVNHPRYRYNFHSRKQKPGESFHNFITDLRLLAFKCNFCEECRENSIRDQIVVGVYDTGVRQKLLECSKLTAKRAEELCRAAEKTWLGTKGGRNTFVKARKDVRPCCERELSRQKWDNEGTFSMKTFESTGGKILRTQECGGGSLCRKKSFINHSDNDKYESPDLLLTDDADSGMCTPGHDVTHRCDDVTYGEHRITPAKSSVKVVRRMITKCRESKNNILKGLQILRNTDKYEEKDASIPERLSKKSVHRFYALKNTSYSEEESNKTAETSTLRMASLKNMATRETKERFSQNRAAKIPITQTGQRVEERPSFNNSSNTNTVSAALKYPHQRQTLIADAMSRIFHGPHGHRHVTPRELIEETVTELEGRKVNDEPETFIDRDILSCDELDSLPYDEDEEEEEEVDDECTGEGRSFNDRTPNSSFSNDDDLSDTFEYDYDSQGSVTSGVKIGKAGHGSSENGLAGVKTGKTGMNENWAKHDEKQLENEEYILTTYM